LVKKLKFYMMEDYEEDESYEELGDTDEVGLPPVKNMLILLFNTCQQNEEVRTLFFENTESTVPFVYSVHRLIYLS